MEVLIEIYRRLLNEVKPLYHRQCYDKLDVSNRMTGIIGGRGTGKTMFLLNYLRENWGDRDDVIYVSADHLFFSETTLLEFIDRFYKEYAAKVVCIDEVHRYKNWSQELKNIYDSYPNLKIIFSGSSSLNLIKGRYDLSRRAILKRMHGFSLREFLEFKLNKTFPILTLELIVSDSLKYSKDISATPKLLGYFKEYLVCGYYPIFTEISDRISFQEALVAVIDKTIFEDIPSSYPLKTGNIDVFRKLLYFIATSSPGEININKLAKSIQRDNSTISEYLEILRETGLLRFLLINKDGHSLIRNAEKLYLNNTNLLYALCNSIGRDADIGTIRELSAISQIEDAGYEVFYSKQGDIVCGGRIFEIGGCGKENDQIAGIKNAYLIKDDILIGGKNEIPLYLLGFLN